MKTIYISGPMTGLPENNYPAFFQKHAELEEMGHRVENPATNPPLKKCGAAKTWVDFMIDAMRQLERSTHICFLDGWEESPGARIEAEVAKRLGIEVF